MFNQTLRSPQHSPAILLYCLNQLTIRCSETTTTHLCFSPQVFATHSIFSLLAIVLAIFHKERRTIRRELPHCSIGGKSAKPLKISLHRLTLPVMANELLLFQSSKAKISRYVLVSTPSSYPGTLLLQLLFHFLASPNFLFSFRLSLTAHKHAVISTLTLHTLASTPYLMSKSLEQLP